MKGGSGTKTGLFLVELIISLLLFSFCAAICIQIFNAAGRKTKSSENLSRGVFIATAAAEIYKTSGGELAAVSALLDGRLSDNNLLTVWYDENWAIAEADGAYLMTLTKTGSGVAEIHIRENSDDTDIIYSLTVKAVN